MNICSVCYVLGLLSLDKTVQFIKTKYGIFQTLHDILPSLIHSFNQVVLITPEKTSVLECTEASQTFSDKPVEGYDNMADVYTMALDKCSEEVVEQLPHAKAVFVDTVFQFLSHSKVLSYA